MGSLGHDVRTGFGLSRWPRAEGRGAKLLSRRAVLLAGLLASLPPSGLAASSVDDLRALTAGRLRLMTDVARSKWSTGAAIDDPERERALLDTGAAAAAREGLDPEAVAALLGAQIEAAKMVQRSLFARWRAEGRGPFHDADRLLDARRSEIARLSAALVPAWAAARAELASCAARATLDRLPEDLAAYPAAWAVAVGGIGAALPTCR